jgi:AraC family transcriptional activator of pobA
MTIDPVPTYALYGEGDSDFSDQWLHCETIAARSARFDWEISPHRHRNFFQILHLERGGGASALDGVTTVFAPPLVVTVPPRTVHAFRFSRDVEGTVITILNERIGMLLDGSPLLRAALATPHIISLAGDPAAADATSRMTASLVDEYGGSAPGRRALVDAHFSLLLLTLGRRVASAAQSDACSGNPLGRRAAEFRLLVDRAYRAHRSLAHYAAQLGVSETHLNRICRASFGKSALGLINARVILEATRDLTFTRLSVKEIAYSLGFDDAAYFTRFFTKHVGMTPTRFRDVRRRASPLDDPVEKVHAAPPK